MNPHRLLPCVILAALPSLAAAQPITGLGVMGDSLSDEYLDRPFTYAKNWVEQLRIYRGLNLGRRPLPGHPRGVRCPPALAYAWRLRLTPALQPRSDLQVS